MAKQYKTTGEVRKMFTRIGRVGGNTVKGLVAGGRIFNVLWHKNLIDEKAVKQAAEDVGISTEDVEAAFETAEAARKELESTEASLDESEAQRPGRRKTA